MSPECINERPITVTISSGGKEIISVPQRELFAKYGWEAEDKVVAALQEFKADLAEETLVEALTDATAEGE